MKKIVILLFFAIPLFTFAQTDKDVLNNFVGLWKSNETISKIGDMTSRYYFEIKFYWYSENPNVLQIDSYSYGDLSGFNSGDIGYFYVNDDNSFIHATWYDQWGIVEADWEKSSCELRLKENYVYFSSGNGGNIRELKIIDNVLTVSAFYGDEYQGQLELSREY